MICLANAQHDPGPKGERLRGGGGTNKFLQNLTLFIGQRHFGSKRGRHGELPCSTGPNCENELAPIYPKPAFLSRSTTSACEHTKWTSRLIGHARPGRPAAIRILHLHKEVDGALCDLLALGVNRQADGFTQGARANCV